MEQEPFGKENKLSPYLPDWRKITSPRNTFWDIQEMARFFGAENTFVSAGEIPPPGARTFLKIEYVFPEGADRGEAEPDGPIHKTMVYWEPKKERLYFRRKQHQRDIRKAQWFRLSDIVTSQTYAEIAKILSEEYFSIEIE